MAHKDAETTEIYLEGHDSEQFVECTPVLTMDLVHTYNQQEFTEIGDEIGEK